MQAATLFYLVKACQLKSFTGGPKNSNKKGSQPTKS
jgi:hypothetical protein